MMGPALMLFAAGSEAGGGGSSLTAPRNLTTYEYQAGTKFGLQWTNGDNTASTEVHRDDVLFETRPPGVNTYDVGSKSGNGSHTWKVRHVSGGSVSAFSSSISTVDGAVS